MTENERETEAKFYVRDLKQIEQRLRKLEARLIQPRVQELFERLRGRPSP